VTSQRTGCKCVVCKLSAALRCDLESIDRARSSAAESRARAEASRIEDARLTLARLRGAGREDGPAADRIFRDLLEADGNGKSQGSIEKILLLAFLSAVHRTVSTVTALYPSLSRDDASQHALLVVLRLLRSPTWRNQRSHFAFVQRLKRELFLWAQREARTLPDASCDELECLRATNSADASSFERLALLHHFLNKCQRVGAISEADLNLLVQIKLEGGFAPVRENGNGHKSNAGRQKMKRLVAKLRRLARSPVRTGSRCAAAGTGDAELGE
jgi:hypothetical protein